MKKSVITTLLALGLSTGTAMANDLDQVFSSSVDKTESLSTTEMQSTKGAFSRFSAQLSAGGLGHNDSNYDHRGTFGTHNEPPVEVLAFLDSLGVDTTSLPIGTGFASEEEMLAFFEAQGIDTTNLPTGVGTDFGGAPLSAGRFGHDDNGFDHNGELGTHGQPPAEILALRESLDIANLPIGTGFASEEEMLDVFETQGIDTTNLPISTGFGDFRGFSHVGNNH